MSWSDFDFISFKSVAILSEIVLVEEGVGGDVATVGSHVANVCVRVDYSCFLISQTALFSLNYLLLEYCGKVGVHVPHGSTLVHCSIILKGVRIKDGLAGVLSLIRLASKVNRTCVTEAPLSNATFPHLVSNELVPNKSDCRGTLNYDCPSAPPRDIVFENGILDHGLRVICTVFYEDS